MVRRRRVRGNPAGETGAGYDSRRDRTSRRNGRRLRSVGFRGAGKDTGNHALAACAALHPITPIRPPRVKSAENSPAALRSSAAGEKRSGPRVSDLISIIGCRAWESLCTKHLSRVNPAPGCRSGGRGLHPRPRNSSVPSYRPIQRRAGSMACLPWPVELNRYAVGGGAFQAVDDPEESR